MGDSPGEGGAGASESLDAAWERGRAAWPALGLPKEVFAPHLSALLAAADAGGAQLGELHVADVYLACACGHGLPAAMRVLERDYLVHVPRYLAKTSSDPAFADEVLQAVRSKLLVHEGGPPKILEYAGRGSLGAWLRVTAVRTAQTLLRQRGVQNRATEPQEIFDALGESMDGELQMLRAKLGPAVTEALRDAIRSLSAEQRNLLRLHYFEGLSFERMGALFQVNRATACRWVAEARRAIVLRTRQKLRDELGLRESDLDTFTRLLRSQLDVSMSSLFAAE